MHTTKQRPSSSSGENKRHKSSSHNSSNVAANSSSLDTGLETNEITSNLPLSSSPSSSSSSSSTTITANKVISRGCKKCGSECGDGDGCSPNPHLHGCTPEKCGIIEVCEGCGGDINCYKENLHIQTKDNGPEPDGDLCYCIECCQDKSEEMVNAGWKCDECDDEESDDGEDAIAGSGHDTNYGTFT